MQQSVLKLSVKTGIANVRDKLVPVRDLSLQTGVFDALE